MSRGCFRIFDESEVEEIHDRALDVLERTGVSVAAEGVRSILQEAGALPQSGRSDVLTLPSSIVSRALASCKRPVALHDRAGRHLELTEGNEFHFCGAYNVRTLDLVLNTERKATRRDVGAFTRLAHALEAIDGVCPVVYAVDAPAHLGELYTLAEVLLNTTKHCLAAPLSYQGARWWIELAQAACGTPSLDEHPIVSAAVSTTSPLQLEQDSAAGLVEMARAGIPIITLPCPMAGGTTPITLAGTLVVQHAEALFLLTLAQAARPGCPVVYGAVGANMDLRSGCLSMGSPEFGLYGAATAALARHLNLPSYAPVMTNAKRPDIQAGAEKMLAFALCLTGGLTLTIGAGALDNCLLASYEQMVIDHEFLRAARRLAQGIEVNDRTMAADVIEEVGPGGSFLTATHTLDFLRSGEHFESLIYNAPGTAADKRDMLVRARERACELLREHPPEVPGADAIKAVVRAAEGV